MKIQKPTLIVDRQKAVANIEKMEGKARGAGVRFRPHFKTHQSAQVGEWFRELGVKSITVSSVSMAEYFCQFGWRDMTIAFPVNLLEIEKINRLAAAIDLGLLVDSVEAADFLAERLSCSAGTWIEIDTGMGRSGVRAGDRDRVAEIAGRIAESDLMNLRGILTHAGHSYGARSLEEILDIHRDSLGMMRSCREYLAGRGFDGLEISVGDTPTASASEDFAGADEIRPGNFIFYDVMQLLIGSCTGDDIALSCLCPVVGKYESRGEICVYGGAVHLSKESVNDSEGRRIFGYAVKSRNGLPGPVDREVYVSSLSQEHGIIRGHDEFIRSVSIGDAVLVLPVHSCLAVNLMGRMHTPDGGTLEAARL